MNKPISFAVAVLLASLVISCKQSDNAISESNATSDSRAVATDSVAPVAKTTKESIEKPQQKRIRTADIKCKINDVYKATEKIEKVTKQCGGYISSSDLQSNITHEEKIKISADSSIVATNYTMQNHITLRVPNQKMDTLIKCIASQVGFLNYKVTKENDVSLQLLANEMAQQRSQKTEERLAHSIDSKGKKLNQVMEAEALLDRNKEAKDEKTLQNLSLNDQVNYSTLQLELYQDPSTKQELIANEKSIDSYRPNIGLQLWDSITKGWKALETLLAFLLMLWPFLLMGGIGVWGYRKYFKN